MNNKERLEKLETKYSTLTVSSERDGIEYAEVDVKDLVFLIQNGFKQAERVEELEIQLSINTNNMKQLQKEKDEWKDTAKSYYMTNQELMEQNKRYREALEEIMKIQENHEWNLYGLAYAIAERTLFELEGEE